VKVGDFGNSRLRDLNTNTANHNPARKLRAAESTEHDRMRSLTGGVGTPVYMAPELLKHHNRVYGNEVDVYSFAIVMWELLTMMTPWAAELKSATYLQFLNELETAIFAGIRPSLPAWCTGGDYTAYVRILERCWVTDPNKRPPFSSLAPELASLVTPTSRLDESSL
jgi:serine/threonine protein kinase